MDVQRTSRQTHVSTATRMRQQQQMVYKKFMHNLSALILTRAFILAPLERMKIIMQVRHIANYINPSDRPKNALDLSNKISVNQGIFAYYRGNAALIYKLSISYGMKYFLYETVFQTLLQKDVGLTLSSIGASTFAALLTTAATYPFDMAHGRMCADMSKKSSVVAVNKSSPLQNRPGRLYSSVRECLTKTQEQSGVLQSKKFLNIYKGAQSALLAQVPYTIILMSSFEALNKLLDSSNTKFNKRDDIWFIYKFLIRFGASSLSLLIAQAICYPLDTIKRRMQLNGSQGHKNLYKNDYHCLQKILKEEGYRGLYQGWTINLIRCIPLTLIQYVMFQNLRFLSKQPDNRPPTPSVQL